MRSPQVRNLSRIKQDDYFQDYNNKNNINSTTKKQENTFNHRGRIFLPSKKDDSKQVDKIQQFLPKKQQNTSQSFQTKSALQNKLSSTQNNLDAEVTIPTQLNTFQKVEDYENSIYDSRVSKRCSIENADHYNSQNEKTYRLSTQLTKDNIVENQINNIDNIDNENNIIDLTDRVKSENIYLKKSVQKDQDKILNSKSINNQISTNTLPPQTTGRWKKKLLRPKVAKKSFNQHNTQLLEDKQSDVEIDDDNNSNNKDIHKRLTSNEIHIIVSPVQSNNHTNEENTDRNDGANYLSQNILSLELPITSNDLQFSDQNNQDSFTYIDQQKTLQTENEGGENKRLSQSQLIIFDNDNEEQINEYNDNLQNLNGQTPIQMTKQKSTQQKDMLDDLVEVQEDDNLSSSLQGDYDDNRNIKTNLDFIPTSAQIKNNIEKEKILLKKSDTTGSQLKLDLNFQNKKGKDQSQSDQLTSKQYFESGMNQDIQQNSPTKFDNIIEKQKSTQISKQIQNSTLEKKNLSIHENKVEIDQQPQFVNQEQLQNTNYQNQDDITTIGDQQDIVTKSDKQQTPRKKFVKSYQNSVNQISQKGNNISLGNFNNDSNFFGSESTNEPNSVKKNNLTLSQLSYNFGKQNKNHHDQKAQMSGYESNNNSQETVKLQSNSKNFMEFAQYSHKRFPNEEEDEEKPEIIQYISKPYFSINPASPQNNSHQTNLRASIDYLTHSQNNQQSTSLDHQSGIFANIDFLQKKQNQIQQEKSDHIIGQQKQRSEKNNVQYSTNELRDMRKNSREHRPFESIQSKGKQNRKQNSNTHLNVISTTELEQSSNITDQTNAIGQTIFNNNNFSLNDKKQIETDRDRQLTKQSPLLQNQNGKELNKNKKSSSPQLSSINNVYFTDTTQKPTKLNEQSGNNQQNQVHTDEAVITVGDQNNINSLGQAKQGDDSPSIENNNSYISFWNHYKKIENEQREFTCKELCYLIWPQTLDRKKRHDKELILKLYQTAYNQDDLKHRSLYDVVSLSYDKFIHGNNQQQIDDKHFSRIKFQRNSLQPQSNKLNEDSQKKLYSVSEAQIDPKTSFDLKAFTLIHILAFLNIYRDMLDITYRKLFKKIQPFLLLIRISNVVLIKFKQSLFDKSIKTLNKDVFEFLNDIFYSIFYESINSIIVLEKFEANKLSIKLYDKLDQINKQLNSTEEILKFLQKNNPQQLKTIQTVSNIFH